MIVVADTSPINYLLLINRIGMLPVLFERIHIPQSVVEELNDVRAPEQVRRWAEALPEWVSVHEIANADLSINYLGRGERDGIALAKAVHADLVLIDEQVARQEAEARQFIVTGTLGVLKRAAEMNLTDLHNAIEDLQATSFYISPAVLSKLLKV